MHGHMLSRAHAFMQCKHRHTRRDMCVHVYTPVLMYTHMHARVHHKLFRQMGNVIGEFNLGWPPAIAFCFRIFSSLDFDVDIVELKCLFPGLDPAFTEAVCDC